MIYQLVIDLAVQTRVETGIFKLKLLCDYIYARSRWFTLHNMNSTLSNMYKAKLHGKALLL